MNDEEKFDVVLEELRLLLLALGDFADHIVLIGGQVVAILQKEKTGMGRVDIDTPVGIVVTRGFTYDADLLLAFDGTALEWRGEEFTGILRSRGFDRGKPDTRWVKQVGEVVVPIDLFVTPDFEKDAYPSRATIVQDGDFAAATPAKISLPLPGGQLELRIPGPLAYLALKLDAKLRSRPNESKDSFDLYAYVQKVGVDRVAHALKSSVIYGPRVAKGLQMLFGTVNADGVKDIIKYSRTSLEQEQVPLLAQAVVDLFSEIEVRGMR